MKNNIDLFVEDIVREMFRGTSKNILAEDVKADTSPTKTAKRELGMAFQQYYDNLNTNDELQDFKDRAKNIGINLDKGAARNAEHNDRLKKSGGSYEKAVGTMSDELKNALNDYNAWINPKTTPDERTLLGNKWGGRSGFQRYLDIADKLSLTPAYDQKNAAAAGINNAPFGTLYKASRLLKNDDGTPKKDAEGKYMYDDNDTYYTGKKPQERPEKKDDNGNIVKPYLPPDKVTEYNIDHLNLTNVTKDEICTYFTTGTRKDHHIGEIDTNPTYGDMAKMVKDGDKKALADLKNLYFKAMFNKIMNSKYGYDFKMPTAMYTYGNAKLPNDTLVINFTSAHRCPAWTDCAVGYACYARGSEHNYEGLHKKNSNLHLMWETAHNDPNLLSAMFKVVKMHLINPGNIAGALLDNPETSQKWFKILSSEESQGIEPLKGYFNRLGKQPDSNILAEPKWDSEPKKKDKKVKEGVYTLGDLLSEAGRRKDPNAPLKKPKGAREKLSMLVYSKKISELFDEKDLAVIKRTPNALRAKFIRLNEEGDFIGQWLLNAFDDFAGEVKLVGINTAAYTCRNLNFDRIKNIIINASTKFVGKNHKLNSEPGEDNAPALGKDDSSAAIARRFFAVPSELYNRLEDTYRPNGRKFDYKIPEEEYDENGKKIKRNKKDYDGSKPIIPLHETSDGLHVIYDLKPFVNSKDSTSPETFNDVHDKNGPTIKRRLYYKCPCGRHGDVLDEKGKPIKMDCYLCRMCYEPKNEETGEIYVLVELHGDNTDSFNDEKASEKRDITNDMQTYKEAKEALHNLICESDDAFIKKDDPKEKGIEIVAENIINSVKEHLNDIAMKIDQKNRFNNMPTESKQFFRMMNLINEADKKRYNDIID